MIADINFLAYIDLSEAETDYTPLNAIWFRYITKNDLKMCVQL